MAEVSDPPSPDCRTRTAVGLAARHPLLVVAGVAALVAVGHAVWIWHHRQLGAFDADEAGYLATTLRNARLLTSDPFALPRSIGGSGAAPLVPIVGTPLALLAPHEPRVLMVLQPLLAVMASVGVAALVRRLAGPAAAIAAGVVFSLLPTVVFASQSYWFGLGATVAYVGALWALLASERLTNRHALTFGACMAAAVLARTMMLGYLPGLLLAAAVLAGTERRSWRGLATSVAVLLGLAGPWYLVARDGIFGYLFSYGYGETAGVYGQGGPGTRVLDRLCRIQTDVATPWVLGLALVVAVVGCGAWLVGGSAPRRTLAALACAAVGGFAALVTTSNAGVWFELPLVALLVAVGAAGTARAPRPAALAVLGAFVLGGIAQLAVSWWWIGPEVATVPFVDSGNRSSQHEYAFTGVDERFLPARRSEAPDAAGEWRSLSDDVQRQLRAIDPSGRAAIWLAGSFPLFNVSTVMLAGELDGWTPRLRVPDTGEGTDLDAQLTPTTSARAAGGGGTVERVLVIADHSFQSFPADVGAQRLEAAARRGGWEVVARHPMPTGGEVRILRHRSTS
jgi:hypothetical protein